ncbi:hypothetical protein GCM10009715_17310 [Paeniglutamicibacter psychrophenolicus]|uniref:Phage tail protein n=1 Tax=Paeniglutamicibacter psychrophenolicus TaxID=257454 RepID=A0ABS4WCU1_9MICC|nr:hypothetical protein [Paeniglutamicibacter psychrophenolicus]MBP2373975.1 putative phage tail protein [Paeniglutamicibacter psychrophenolicus]
MSEHSVNEHTASGTESTRFPVGTLVFGLILIVIAAAVLLSLLTGIQVNGGLLAIGVLVFAGLAMVIGGIAASRRHD